MRLSQAAACRTSLRAACLAASMIILTGGSARPQSLTLAVGSAPTSVDPHYSVLTSNVSLMSHIYDGLINRDAQSKPIPGLALAWSMIDDTTWEFRLRPNVTFHNGQPFTAENVAGEYTPPSK